MEGDTRKLAEMGLIEDKIDDPWGGSTIRDKVQTDIVNSQSISRLSIEN